MHLPLIAVVSFAACARQVLGEVGTYEYSNQNPWSFVYTLYPFYNSETLLEVWREGKTVDVSTNVATLSPREQEQFLLYSDDVQNNGTIFKSQDNASYFSSQGKMNEEQLLSKNGQRISNYRNAQKAANLQNE